MRVGMGIGVAAGSLVFFFTVGCGVAVGRGGLRGVEVPPMSPGPLVGLGVRIGIGVAIGALLFFSVGEGIAVRVGLGVSIGRGVGAGFLVANVFGASAGGFGVAAGRVDFGATGRGETPAGTCSHGTFNLTYFPDSQPCR